MQSFSSISNHYENQKSLSLNHTQNKRSSFFKPVTQPKLTINQPSDVYEQEADAVADRVMRMTGKDGMHQPFFKPAILPIQRKCAHCEEEENQLQRKEINKKEATANDNFENYVGGLKGNGQALPEEVKNFYEPRFGYDFSDVKIHTA